MQAGAGVGCWPGRPSDRGPGGILVRSSAMPAGPASGSALPAGANAGPVSAVAACLAMGPGPAGHIRCAGHASVVRRQARSRREFPAGAGFPGHLARYRKPGHSAAGGQAGRLWRRLPRRAARHLQPAGHRQFRLPGPGMPGPVTSTRGSPPRADGHGSLRPPDEQRPGRRARRGSAELWRLRWPSGPGRRPDYDDDEHHQQQRQHDHEPEQRLAVHGRMAHRCLLACWASLLGLATPEPCAGYAQPLGHTGWTAATPVSAGQTGPYRALLTRPASAARRSSRSARSPPRPKPDAVAVQID